MDSKSKLMSIINAFGVTSMVKNFPDGLPNIIAKSPELNNSSPGLGASMSAKIHDIVSKLILE